ncbi:MAG: PIG-L family deacetylase [Bryobacterales bacterium]|nr:PIG-L family deacetylase [Bryobacterales bacterium]
MLRGLLILLLPLLAVAQERTVLWVTAKPSDAVLAAGGAIAQLARDGFVVRAVQFTNDEKGSLDLGPAATREASDADAERAMRALGVAETVRLGHKAGELGYVSTTEMRNELVALIRFFKPVILFVPDPYVHYLPDRDHFYLGKMAEEAWGYSGGGMFNHELKRMGFPGYSVPEIYYYAPRPYAPGEGGEGRARLREVDITGVWHAKLAALTALETNNRQYASHVRIRLRAAGLDASKVNPDDTGSVAALVKARALQLAEAIGGKHGIPLAEEFNYVGGPSGQPHIDELAVPKK